MSFTDKQLAFIECKAAGSGHADAAMQAGYAASSSAVTATKLMARKDIRAAIKAKQAGVDNEPDTDEPEPWKMKDKYPSSLALLQDLYNNKLAPKSLRYQAAKDALPYEHPRKEGGKKDAKDEAAKEAGKGKFRTASKPGMRLVSSR